MDKPAWTEGPWEVRKAKTLTDGVLDYGIGADINHAGYCIAEVFGRVDEDCYPPAEATAHLIAAAPDLYKALEDVMDWITNWSPPFTDDDEWPDTKARVDAALAKARGETDDG